MTQPLKERLVAVESSQDDGFNPTHATTNWYRNPDGPEALARIEVLEGALRAWNCPSCGGSRVYHQRTKDGDEHVHCRVCDATGLHPTARSALNEGG